MAKLLQMQKETQKISTKVIKGGESPPSDPDMPTDEKARILVDWRFWRKMI